MADGGADVAGRVVEKLARLDKGQLRDLVEDLRLALLDAVPAADPVIADIVTKTPNDRPPRSDPKPSGAPPPTVDARSESAWAGADAEAGTPPSPRRLVPRRVGVALASGCFATIAAALLFVPAANPPVPSVEETLQAAAVEPASGGRIQPPIEPQGLGSAALEATGEERAAGGATAREQSAPATSTIPEAVAVVRRVGQVPAPQPTRQSVPDGGLVKPAAMPHQPSPGSAGGNPKSDTNLPKMPSDALVRAVNAGPEMPSSAAPAPPTHSNASPAPSVATAPRPASDASDDPANTVDAPTAPRPAAVAPSVVVSATESHPPSQVPSQSDGGPSVGPSAPSAANIQAAPQGLAPDVMQALLQRGDHFLALGDIVSARLSYERAAEGGSSEAATGMARTFDPQFLKQIGAVGIRGDKIKAVYWYRRASEGGDGAATERLNSLLADDSG